MRITPAKFQALYAMLHPTEKGCRLWPKTSPGVYPVFSVLGRGVRANRYALEQHLGRPLHEGMQALHKCDDPRCVAAEHLFEGSCADNMRDKCHKHRQARGVAHGSYTKPERRPSGETHGRAKVTWAIVEAMREAHANGTTIREVMAITGLGYSPTKRMLKGKTWANKPSPPKEQE